MRRFDDLAVGCAAFMACYFGVMLVFAPVSKQPGAGLAGVGLFVALAWGGHTYDRMRRREERTAIVRIRTELRARAKRERGEAERGAVSRAVEDGGELSDADVELRHSGR